MTTFLPAENSDAASPLFEMLDLDRVALAGHSRGGKASLLAAENELNGLVDAWFGLDPVDASTLADGSLARDGLDLLDVPLGFLFAQVESSCSPADTTEAALWPNAPSPAVKIVGVGAGHVQLEDADECVACGFCSPSGTQPDDVVIAYANRYLAAFMARELLDDASVGAGLEGAGASLDADVGLITVETR